MKRLIISIIVLLVSFILLLFIYNAYSGEYKTPSWKQRVINEYNYNQAVHNKESTTIESNKDSPSWQRRAIDNYNYDQATHNKQKEGKKDND
jgi:hypothetical protein